MWLSGGVVRVALVSTPALDQQTSRMTILDLIKATVAFSAISFLIYSYPLVGQIVLIGFLGILWLSYVRKTYVGLRRR